MATAEIIACLVRGKLLLVRDQELGRSEPLPSPFLDASGPEARIVSVARGRDAGELCYAVQTPSTCTVLAQIPGSGDERRLFQSSGVRFCDVDFTFADGALACTIEGKRGTSAIGLLADDGKGMHTVTEGDVLDRSPRWAPDGQLELVYASTGIARTRSGAIAALSPSAVHRLRFDDSSVEVLLSDAKYDYSSPIANADGSLYALRNAYTPPVPRPPWAALLERWSKPRPAATTAASVRQLVHVQPLATTVLAENVRAYDITPTGEVVFASDGALFRFRQNTQSSPQKLADLADIDALVTQRPASP